MEELLGVEGNVRHRDVVAAIVTSIFKVSV
jgi:hypothetical protein